MTKKIDPYGVRLRTATWTCILILAEVPIETVGMHFISVDWLDHKQNLKKSYFSTTKTPKLNRVDRHSD